MTIKQLVGVTICLMSSIGLYGTALANDFNDYQSYAQSLTNTPKTAINDYPAKTSLPDYTTTPPQEKYDQGVQQESTSIDTDAENAVTQTGNNAPDDGTGNTVDNDFTSREHYQINSQSQYIQNDEIVKNDYSNITHGVSDQYVNCTQEGSGCTVTYHNKSCREPAQYGDMSCTANLVATVTPAQPITKTITIAASVKIESDTGDLSLDDNSTMTVDINNGRIVKQTVNYGNPFKITISGSVGATSCKQLTVNSHTITNSNGSIIKSSIATMPTCADLAQIKFTTNYNNPNIIEGYVTSKITINVTIEPNPVITTEWVNNCPTIDNIITSGICSPTSHVCTEGKATKTVDGVPVTEDCWQKTTTYNCNGASDNNTCTALANQGCSQIGSTCTDIQNNICLEYQNTYRCPQNTCQGLNMICGHNVFCLDGSCAPDTPSSNANMGEDATELDAGSQSGQAVDAGNYDPDVNADDVHIFGGKAMSCRMDSGGFSDCCSPSGWGQNINLASCSSEEKQLGLARQKGLAHQVGGEYCSHYVNMGLTKICTVHSLGFCMFDDYIPYDVQIQGRLGQLGIGFGASSNPNCRGITPTEEQKIDFSKINWNNFINHVEDSTDVPSEADIAAQIDQQVNQDIANNTGDS